MFLVLGLRPCTLQRVRTAICEQAHISDATTVGGRNGWAMGAQDLQFENTSGDALDPKARTATRARAGCNSSSM